MTSEPAQNVLDVARDAAEELIVFSKLERLVAAVCMATPFFLILADSQERINFWSIVVGTITIMTIPLIVAIAAYRINGMAKLIYSILTFACAFLFVALLFYAWYWTLPLNFNIRDSISSYVAMENAQLFGLLMTTASMLFLFNGAIYINKVREGSTKKHGKWYNIVLGISLLGVVLFPCTNPKLAVLHYACAVLFFGGSALVIAIFNDEKHRVISIMIAAVSLSSVTLFFVNERWLNNPALDWFTLFWAETIAMWVIGIHYILQSLGELK